MALFFDYKWFDAQLAAQGHSRDDAAKLLGLSRAEIDQLFKDQREMSADDVLALAAFLDCAADEIADRAGVSTPVPKSAATPEERLTSLTEQVTLLHTMVQRLADRVLMLEQANSLLADKAPTALDKD